MNLTTAITAPARHARRASKQRLVPRLPTPSESRILSLRESPARYTTTTARAAVVHAAARPPRRRRFVASPRVLADAAFWLVIVTVIAGGAYFIDRGGHPAGFTSSVSSAHRASSEGSGRIALPAAAGDVALRVGIEAVPGETDYWFWCFESSAALPVEDHFCRNTGFRDPVTGYTIAEGVAHVDASAASGATYFVQLYCPNRCRWWMEATTAATSVSKR